MFINQRKYMLCLVISAILINSVQYVEAQGFLPTQDEQVNLLTKVHELFEQIKQTAKVEQTGLDQSIDADMAMMMRTSRLSIDTLEELTLLKLSTGSNAVCAFDAKQKIEDVTNETFYKLANCAKEGTESLNANSLNLTANIESAINSGEEFLDKLNRCSEKRGLGVIGCYRKIIQNDVLPVKKVLSDAIENHQNAHLKAFGLKAGFNQCAEQAIESLKNQLDLALENGLNCK